MKKDKSAERELLRRAIAVLLSPTWGKKRGLVGSVQHDVASEPAQVTKTGDIS